MTAEQNREITPGGHEYENEARPSFLRTIEKVKREARIEQIAPAYGEFRLKADGSLVGRCPTPHHEDRTPSCFVYPDSQRYRCYGCLSGGDVLDFIQAVEDCDLLASLVILQEVHGVELPARPPAWFAKNERQAPARNAVVEARVRRVQRRVYKWIIAPPLKNIGDEAERREEARHAWEESGRVARLLVAALRSQGLA